MMILIIIIRSFPNDTHKFSHASSFTLFLPFFLALLLLLLCNPRHDVLYEANYKAPLD